MNFLRRIKDRIGEYFLRKEFTNKRGKPLARNMGETMKMALIYEAEDEATFDQVRNYVKYIKEEHGVREVKALGFVDSKHMPDHLYPRLEFEQFTRKDLTWYRKPKGVAINNFVEREYDVLVDLSDGSCLPLQFVLAMSRARFRVGRRTQGHEEGYDMMMEVSPETDLEKYIEYVDHYLTLINKKEVV